MVKKSRSKPIPGYDTPVKARASSLNPASQRAKGAAPRAKVKAGGRLSAPEREAIKSTAYARKRGRTKK